MIGSNISTFIGSGNPPSFDDVMMVPAYSEVRSRSQPDTSSVIAGINLNIPIISSPMDTVTGTEMAVSMANNGGLGIIHRFASKEDQASMMRSFLDESSPSALSRKLVPAIGVGNNEKDRLTYLLETFGMDISSIAIDVANGDSNYMADMISWVLKETMGKIPIIAGNVATGEAFIRLCNLGVSAVRVGIGGGSICKTRIMTGVGVPTLSSVIDCHNSKVKYGFNNVGIIADGGVRYPADFVKSLASGADAIMAGRIFAGTLESPGDIVSINGVKMKVYRGMASKEVQEDKRGGMRPGTCAEGVSTHIPLKGKAHYILNEFAGGLRSAMTYMNSLNLSSLRENAKFIRLTSSALDESHAFGTKK